jgi:hypothetical protein
MLKRAKLIRKSLLLIFLVLLVGLACEIPGLPSSPGTPEVQPTEGPAEPTQPPAEPTQPPAEPTQPPAEATTPPETVPTSPAEGGLPDEGGDEGGSTELTTVLFWLLIVVIAILGVALIVSLFTGRRKESAGPMPAQPGEPPSYAASAEEPPVVGPVPQAAPMTALDNISPAVAELYDRFVNMIQALGTLTILPTQTRVDFQRKIIFASAQFSAEDMRVKLLLPRRVDDPRMVRIEVISEDKIAHSLIIRSMDDFDVNFSTWLGEAYQLGG